MAVQSYKHQSLLDKGYIRIKLSRSQHKAIFRVRKIRIWDTYAYYYNGEEVIVEHFLARWFVALIFVPFLLIGTLSDGFPSTWQELKKCLFPHRYGSLSADSWRVIPGKHSVDEQPIVDYWLKRMADAKKVD
ncbi:TPA: hypothetical protein OUX94_004826 [Escherichia coli]|nr:hypothetical protein [Escherichia coli]